MIDTVALTRWLNAYLPGMDPSLPWTLGAAVMFYGLPALALIALALVVSDFLDCLGWRWYATPARILRSCRTLFDVDLSVSSDDAAARERQLQASISAYTPRAVDQPILQERTVPFLARARR